MNIGALTKLSKYITQFRDELLSEPMRRKLADIAYDFEMGAGPDDISKADRRTLLDYLRDEGGQPEWRDMHIGMKPITFVGGDDIPKVHTLAVPDESSRLFRGADVHFAPQKDVVFTTTDPQDAAWFAAEFTDNPHGVGAITEYALREKANPARRRDMFDIALSDDAMFNTIYNKAHTSNVWDWAYIPEFRQAMKDRGFNSALGMDILERDEIEAFIPLSNRMLQPVSRMVTIPDYELAEKGIKKELPEFEGLRVLSPFKPYTKRAKGGLVQACGCDK